MSLIAGCIKRLDRPHRTWSINVLIANTQRVDILGGDRNNKAEIVAQRPVVSQIGLLTALLEPAALVFYMHDDCAEPRVVDQ